MLLRILKKDMMNRKGVNIILFFFITLATIFLASSVNNIMIVSSATEYYMDNANVPALNVITSKDDDKAAIDGYLNELKEEHKLRDFQFNYFLTLSEKSLQIEKNDKWKGIDSKSASLYLAKMNVDYCKVFDQKGKSFTLAQGEVGLPVFICELNGLKIGDTVQITIGNVQKKFKLSVIMKDAAFGDERIGMCRILVNEKDYDVLQQNSTKLGIYYIDGEDSQKLSNLVNNKTYGSVINIIARSTYEMVYIFDMIFAALLILIGICMILIALLVLRFTLLFTMEEQYHEIGILKAIGLKNYDIKKMYLIKYLAVVTTGAILGMVSSIPVSQWMLDSVSANIIMESSQANIGIILLCGLVVILLTLGFCYFCTRKLNKVSAITAIRGGNSGERYNKLRGIQLSNRKHMSATTFLGINDISSNLRRYAILIITFCISFILITIPLNTINTMRSKEMVSKFMLNPNSSVYVSDIEKADEDKYDRMAQLNAGITRLKQEMAAKGYQNVKMTAAPLYFLKFASKESEQWRSILTIQVVGDKEGYVEYSEGVAPLLENEVAFSKNVLEENEWKIGDYVTASINGKKRTLLITATYSDYMQLGKSARLNPALKHKDDPMFDYWSIMVEFDTTKTQEEAAHELQKEFPSYKWETAQGLVDRNIGGIQETLQSMLVPMTAMLCGVIMLITLLMEKMFITREKGEIAMMKSIGFTYQSIRKWQLKRMLFVTLTSLIVSLPLSLLSNQFVLKPIFGIMGAEVNVQVDPICVYIVYPGILLIGILVATGIAARGIKKIHIKEINTLE